MKHNWERDENGNINEWAREAGFHNGVFCVDCGKSVCVHCNPDYMELDDCTDPQKSKVITNADRIRAMSDQELAEHIWKKFGCPAGRNYVTCGYAGGCKDCWLDWLQQPAEEDT